MMCQKSFQQLINMLSIMIRTKGVDIINQCPCLAGNTQASMQRVGEAMCMGMGLRDCMAHQNTCHRCFCPPSGNMLL